MSINSFNAVGIAEGFIQAESEEQVIEAWQYLIDSGLAWKLQGWFGRTANQLIEEGYCSAPRASADTELGAIPANFYFCP
jgi:UDP-N-acetylenolpyruvoylglucosamine reductase